MHRPRRSIRWLTPLGRSVGLRRQAAAEHPLTNTPRAELVGLLREAAAEHPLANTPRGRCGYHVTLGPQARLLSNQMKETELLIHTHAVYRTLCTLLRPQQGCASPINCRRPGAAATVTAQRARRSCVGVTARTGARARWRWRAGCRARRLCRSGTLGALARLGSGSHRDRRRRRSRRIRRRRRRVCPLPRHKLHLPVHLVTYHFVTY